MADPSAQAGRWNILGHETCVTVLRHGLARGDLAHAYLLTGPSGIGKSTLARELALALVCTPPARAAAPCRTCMQCRLALAGNHPDVTVLARDAERQVIRAEQIRDLEERIILLPYQAARSVYLIEDADLLHESAANALLKTLEEPPAHASLV